MNPMINERDLISMKLLHYFITKRNYNPIMVQGVENEIWLENLEEEYKVVRIVNNYIHNDEQLDFDIFKTQRMIKKIKRKTLTFNMKALSILTDVGDNVDLNRKLSNVQIVYLRDEDALHNNTFLNSVYKDLIDNLQFSEDGFQLFLKITTEINEKNKKKATDNEKLFESKTPIVTSVIIGILVLIFILGNVLGYQDYLISKFGVWGYGIRKGEVYRLLTGTFLHGGILHLLFNCYALWTVGNQIESFYGKKKFIVIYLFSALTGSLLSIGMHDGLSIGASGAIFGLFGSLLYFGYYYRVYFGSVIIRQVLPVILLNLFIGLTTAGIDNYAHIGGLIGGILSSMALSMNSREHTNNQDRINGIILSIIFLGFLIYLGIFSK